MMPYKASGKRVYVKKQGKWRLFKQLASPTAAKKYAAALNIHAHKK